jgi:hypothetical protein
MQVCVRCETPFTDASADPDIDLQRPAAPSRVQTHGTMAAVVVAGVVAMGLLFAFSVRHVGPFKGVIVATRGSGATVTVTARVTNAGSRSGRGNCRVRVKGDGDRLTNVAPFLTVKIPAKGSVTQDVQVPTTDGLPAEISCS